VASNIPADIDLKTLPTSVYEWPVDLPRPTLVSTSCICNYTCISGPVCML
jgi:hypothetical protein